MPAPDPERPDRGVAGPEGAGLEPRYPGFISTYAEMRRWELASTLAGEIFGDFGDPGIVWSATRALYDSDIPT